MSGATIEEYWKNSDRLTGGYLLDENGNKTGKILTHWYVERILKHTWCVNEPWPVKGWNGHDWDHDVDFIPVTGTSVEDCRLQMQQYMQERGFVGEEYRLSRFDTFYTPYMPLIVTTCL